MLGLLAYIFKGIGNGLLYKSGTVERTFGSVLCIADSANSGPSIEQCYAS